MQYEMTFIVFDEGKVKLVKDALEHAKAKILLENPMGRRNFAYPVKKERTGFYFNYYFSAEPTDLEAIDKALRTERELVRYLIIKNDEEIEEIKAKIERMKQKKEPRKTSRDMANEEVKTEKSKAEVIEESEKADVVSKTSTTTKKSPKDKIKEVKTEKPVAKVKKEKKAPAPKAEKSADDQERIKKLEEKLDELLKD